MITFHAHEDRVVKTYLRAHDAAWRMLHGKPLRASADEVARNRQSRTAALRVAEARSV